MNLSSKVYRFFSIELIPFDSHVCSSVSLYSPRVSKEHSSSAALNPRFLQSQIQKCRPRSRRYVDDEADQLNAKKIHGASGTISSKKFCDVKHAYSQMYTNITRLFSHVQTQNLIKPQRAFYFSLRIASVHQNSRIR